MGVTFELAVTGSGDPHRFTATVGDGNGGAAAEHTFEWRPDSTALTLDLGELARAAVAGEPPEDDVHRRLGGQLYEAAFGGPVGELWRQRLAELRPRRRPLRLVLRLDPKTARPLLDLPWEYLHDGEDFLALGWRTPLSRLPLGLPAAPLEALREPLRLLVLIAAPLDLGENEVLDFAREEDLILEATAAARRAGQVTVDFAAAGSPEALETALRDFDPHLLHFTGHGVFDPTEDQGFLLMETAEGRRRRVPNRDFAARLERRGRSLRLVFLAACQSARSSGTDGYTDLAPRLLAAGIPAVVAMKQSVLNRSAMELGRVFYREVAGGEAVDAALTAARQELASRGLNRVDFGVPALYLSDPDCLRVDEAALTPAAEAAPLDLTGVAIAARFAGRTTELRELRAGLDPRTGPWRAAVVHGLGGMGKTVLAARLAQRLAPHLDGVVSLRASPTTTARDVLEHLAAFLQVNHLRLGSPPRVGDLAELLDQPVPLEAKAAPLVEILRGLALLVIFDNWEDVLPHGHTVSRAASREADRKEPAAPEVDPDLAKLVRLLIEGVPGPSRFLFTSRVDFEPLEPGRLSDAVGRLALSEMRFREAVYLMESLPPLDRLPVAVVTGAGAATAETGEIPGEAPSLRGVYERLGGHPYTLNLFAEHARRSSVEAVLGDLSGVRKDLLEATLLDRAAASHSERAAELLSRAAVYEEAVPVEGLAYLLGDESDCMPPVDEEVTALRSWGLLTRPPGTEELAVPTPVRDWARGRWAEGERRPLLLRAAEYWQAVGRESTYLDHWLNARHYLFQAGEYERADDIVQSAFEYLLRWGQIYLVFRLLNESVRTLSGARKAVAVGNRARVYEGVGDYEKARRDHETVLAEFEAAGDKKNVAVALHQLGNLHYQQGEYGPARQRYEQSLALLQELGDKDGIASSIAQLGLLLERTGDTAAAVPLLAQAFAIFHALGSPRQEMARRDLARLRETLGEEAFEAALREGLGSEAAAEGILQALAAQPEVEEPNVLALAVKNTVAVLTSAPEKKQEWKEVLGQVEKQAETDGQVPAARFFGILRRLVDGDDPATLTPQVPEELRPAWDAILQGLSRED